MVVLRFFSNQCRFDIEISFSSVLNRDVLNKHFSWWGHHLDRGFNWFRQRSDTNAYSI